jgi:hypothetical protein
LKTLYRTWEIQVRRLDYKAEGNFEGLAKLKEEEDAIYAEALKDYRRPIYLRVKMKELYDTYPIEKKRIDARCKRSFTWWCNFFSYTYDPRLVGSTLPPTMPLIMYPGQREVMDEIHECWQSKQPFLVEKSRADGLTELICAYMIWHWLYTPGFKGTLGSRGEREVEDINNPDALFSRLRRMIYLLPKHMRPESFWREGGPNDKRLNIYNPDIHSIITGEIGDDIGRGGRSSLLIVDEYPTLDHPQKVDASVSYNADTYGYIGTPRGMNRFYHHRTSGKMKVLTTWWYDNPAKNPHFEWRGKYDKDSAWLVYQNRTKPPEILAQEIWHDYAASVEGVFIPADWVNAAVNFKIFPEGERIIGFDIAAGGKNKSVQCMRIGPVVTSIRVVPFKNAIEATWKVIDTAEECNADAVIYDRNSIGEDVYPLVKLSDRPVKVALHGVYGSERASDRFYDAENKYAWQKFRNRRAEIWWELRERFNRTFQHAEGIKKYPEEQLISIPNDENLKLQLSTPRMVFSSSGKIGVESKDEMKRRNVESPDFADACAYCFTDYTMQGNLLNKFDYTSEKTVKVFNQEADLNHNSAVLVSIFQGTDMSMSAICCYWNSAECRLRVFAEFTDTRTDIPMIRQKIDEYGASIHVREWIGNDEMFSGLAEGRETIWYKFRQAGIKIKPNYTDDYTMRSTITTMNDMLENGRIEIHPDCSKLVQQMRNWRIDKGKPQENLTLVSCLCQIITRLHRKQEITQARIKNDYPLTAIRRAAA